MCDDCKLHRRRYEKRRRIDAERENWRIVPSVGSRRRVQALQRLGWSIAQIAKHAGWDSPQALQYVMRNDTIIRRTHDRIAATYEELCMTIPRYSSGSVRARNRAIRLGYAPPLAWDDIDNPDETPDLGGFVPGARARHIEDYQWLIDNGCSPVEAANRIGVELASIHRALGVQEGAAA